MSNALKLDSLFYFFKPCPLHKNKQKLCQGNSHLMDSFFTLILIIFN